MFAFLFSSFFSLIRHHHHSYVAEGDVAGTRIMCRVITNCGDGAASAMSSVLERAPRPSEATELPITVFYTPNAKVDFAGFVIEQVRE